MHTPPYTAVDAVVSVTEKAPKNQVAPVIVEPL